MATPTPVSHPGRRPAASQRFVARARRSEAPVAGWPAPGAEIPADRARRPRPHPRTGLRRHRRARHGARALGRCVSAAAWRRSAARSRSTSTSCTSRTRSPARPTLLDDRHHRPRTPDPRRAPARSCRAKPLCRADCAGLCPSCGIDRNSAVVRLRHHRTRSPVGGLAVARSLESRSSRDGRPEAQDEPIGDPLAQVGEHATRAPSAFAVPELRRVAAPAHGVQQLWVVPRPAGHQRRVTAVGGPSCGP